MLTLFSIPKPSAGHIGVIQANAVRSWAALKPRCPIILFGAEAGTKALAQQSSATHLPDVARNKYNTPLLNNLFAQASAHSDDALLCYINADIILMSDFLEAVRRIARRRKRFLMVGRRWDLDITEPLDMSEGWEARLRRRAHHQGSLKDPTNIDYFVHSRDLWGPIPPFAVGRTAFDNWLIYRARSLSVPVIDATPIVTAVHQRHDYNHAGSGAKWIWKGPEARRNNALAGGKRRLFTIWDSTHIATDRDITPRKNEDLGGGVWSYRRSARAGI